MNCSRQLIEGYLDEELDLGLTAEVQEHLGNCRSCSDAHAQIRKQQAEIRSLAPYYSAPARLQKLVHDALRKEAVAEEAAQNRNGAWRWVAIAASVLLAVSFTWNVGRLLSHPPEREMIAQERPLQPRAIVDRNPPAGREFYRSAHRETVVQWQA